MPNGWVVKAGVVHMWVAGNTVYLIVTHRSYRSALDTGHYKVLYKFTFFTLLFSLHLNMFLTHPLN